MRLLHSLVLASALLFPIVGCGGAATGENEEPTDVSQQPEADPFSGGTNDLIDTEDGKAALTAPPLDFNSEQGSKGP